MPYTKVHFPGPVLASLDRIAAERGISRDRLIVESCRRAAEERARWPAGFFSNDHLSAEELAVLRAACDDFDRVIQAARQSRTDPPF